MEVNDIKEELINFLKFYNEIIKVSKMCNVTDEEIVALYLTGKSL